MNKALKAAKRVLPVYRRALDRWTEHVLKEDLVSCRRGCNHCCHNLTMATLAEGAAVAVHLIEKGVLEKHRPQLDATAKLCDSVGTGDSASFKYLATKTPCAFLENGECSIYELRPAVCRTYFVASDPEQCSPDRPGAEVGVVDARAPMSNFITFLIQTTHPAIPMFSGPFPSVVLAGAEIVQRSPGSFKRWMQKSPLFTENVETIGPETDSPI